MIEEKNISHLKDSKERAASRSTARSETHNDKGPRAFENRSGATGGNPYTDGAYQEPSSPEVVHKRRLRQRVGERLKDIGGKMEDSEFKMSSSSIKNSIIQYPMQSLGFALLLGFLIGLALG